jgi:calreticulin
MELRQFIMSKIATAALVASSLVCGNAHTYFKETFDSTWTDRWVSAEGSGKVGVSAGNWHGENGEGLQTQQDAKFYHVAADHEDFSNDGKDLVIQFSVQHGQKIDCGGGYLKFMPAGVDKATFNGDTEYNIMFGPDICGATKKVHVIFNYKGTNHLIKDTIPAKTDEFTHVYTLIVHPDQTWAVKIDGEQVKAGNLVDNWDFLPAKMIKDPEISKPEDWVEQAMIDDPEDIKPEGYDDIAEEIVDPEAEKPDDWSDEDDGEWEAPLIPNPEFKGPWYPKRIDNPEYKGVWEHPEIENPDYAFDDSIYSYSSFGAVGLDVWQVKSGSIFDNIIITDSEAEAEAFLAETWDKDAEKKMYDDAKAAERAAQEAEDALRAAEEAEDEDDEAEEAHDEL